MRAEGGRQPFYGEVHVRVLAVQVVVAGPVHDEEILVQRGTALGQLPARLELPIAAAPLAQDDLQWPPQHLWHEVKGVEAENPS